MANAASTFVIGWEEWVSLPALGLPAIKAKVDTGARTSALHAFQIEPFGPLDAPMVRFGVHPVPGRTDIEIFCSAPVVDRREVTSSNGEKEVRYVIRADVALGERTWPIDISLTNRETMAYRMLLGRQAIGDDMVVEPATSFRQPRLSYRLYKHLPRQDEVRRALRILLLTRAPKQATNELLADAAAARGHVTEMLDPRGLALTFDGGEAGLLNGGVAIGHYDVVIPRVPHAVDVVRQLELMGSVALNAGDALARLGERVATIQALTAAGVRHALPLAGEAEEQRPRLGLLVLGGRVVAGIERGKRRTRDAANLRHETERRLAEAAAAALKLGLARVDISRAAGAPRVLAISARPSLGVFERVTGEPVAAEIVALIEGRARGLVRQG